MICKHTFCYSYRHKFSQTFTHPEFGGFERVGSHFLATGTKLLTFKVRVYTDSTAASVTLVSEANRQLKSHESNTQHNIFQPIVLHTKFNKMLRSSQTIQKDITKRNQF